MYRYADANLVQRMMRKSGAWPGVWWIYARALHPFDALVYRSTKGRTTFTAWVTGLPVVQLTTTGAKTGLRRTLPLLAIPDGEDLVIVASNYGQERHPSWYYNLRANPRAIATFAGRSREMVARELEGDERDRWYERGIEIYPGWIQYRRRTAAHRQIPVISLTPAS